MEAGHIGYLVGAALFWVLLTVPGIWLLVAGSRRIRNGGRYTMKYWSIGLLAFAGLALLGRLAAPAHTSLASTPEPKAGYVAQAASEQPKNNRAEMIVDYAERLEPGTIDSVCLRYEKFGDDAWRAAFAKGYKERMKGYTEQLPSAEAVLDEVLSRCSV